MEGGALLRPALPAPARWIILHQLGGQLQVTGRVFLKLGPVGRCGPESLLDGFRQTAGVAIVELFHDPVDRTRPTGVGPFLAREGWRGIHSVRRLDLVGILGGVAPGDSEQEGAQGGSDSIWPTLPIHAWGSPAGCRTNIAPSSRLAPRKKRNRPGRGDIPIRSGLPASSFEIHNSCLFNFASPFLKTGDA